MNDETKLYLFLGFWMALIILVGGGYILYDSYSSEIVQQDQDIGLEVIADEEYLDDEEITVVLGSTEGPVEGAQAKLDGEEIGTTNENGEIRFTSETGVNTVQFNYEGQEVSETVEVISDEDERSDRSSEEDQEQDGQESDSETESESETGEELEIEITYEPENPSTGDQVSFEASTNAEAESYGWSSFDIQLQEDQGQQIQNRFESPGIYQINGEIETENQETIQESIEIEVQESDSDETEVGKEPEITLNIPSETQTYDEGSIDFEFIVENGVQGSEYQVVIDESSEIARMLPEEGENQITEELTLSTGEYQTHVQVNQNGETYKSETITLTVEEQLEEPQFTLDSPNDGETFETFNEETDVEFQFTVEDRSWAEEATLKIEETDYEYTRPISSGQTYDHDFENVKASESGKNYEYILNLHDRVRETQVDAEFQLKIVEPHDYANLIVDENYGDDSEVRFTVKAESDLQRTIVLEINNEDEFSTDIRDSPFNKEFEFSRFLESAGEHEAQVLVYELETQNLVENSTIVEFETNEDGPEQ